MREPVGTLGARVRLDLVQTIASRALIDLARRCRPARPLFGSDGKPIAEPIAPASAPEPAAAEATITAALASMNPRHREADDR